jgi:hypothetical protein
MADYTTFEFLNDCADMCTEAKVQAESVQDFHFAKEAAMLASRCRHRAEDRFQAWGGSEGARRRGVATLLADLVRFQAAIAHHEGMHDDTGFVVLESWHIVSRSIVEIVVAGFLNAEALGE